MKERDRNQQFMMEISKIKQPYIFLGVAKILKVPLLNSDESVRDFLDIFAEVISSYSEQTTKRKKELLKILKKANKAIDEERIREVLDADRTKTS